MLLPKSRLVRMAATLPLLFLLGGCFKPMYGGLEGTSLRTELASIQIDPIDDRAGHYLANELRFLLSDSSREAVAKYRLQISLRTRVQTSLVDTISQRATAGAIVIDADYKLIPIGGGAPVASGVAFTFAAYDRSSQRFANMRAARDAEIRDAKVLAEQIKTRLSLALAR